MILTGGLSYLSCWITQKSQKCLFVWSKMPKMSFLAIFLSLAYRIDFKLHILILQNDLDKWAVILPMLGSLKNHKNAFWMIQRAENEVFGHLLEFGASDRLQLHILIMLNDLDRWAVISPMLDYSKITKMPSRKWGFWPFSWVWCIRSTWYRIFWKN